MATTLTPSRRRRCLGVGTHNILCKSSGDFNTTTFLLCLRGLLILSLFVTSCESFAASKKKGSGGGGGGFGGAKKQKKGAGFGKASSSSKSITSTGPAIQEINLGPDKTVSIHVPPNALSTDMITKKDQKKFATAASSSSSSNTITTAKAQSQIMNAYGSFRGKGDVIWPSSLHLARLVANCPSFVQNRNVIDLGCGLGLASLATLLGNPTRLVLSDIDEYVLDFAVQSCTEMIAKNNASIKAVEKMCIDWSNKSTYPSTQKGDDFDVVLASDVLYDKEAAQDLSALIAHLLLNSPPPSELSSEIEKRALIVDPIDRQNRDEFVISAARHGLLAQVTPFPGQEDDFVLINVTPAS